MLELVGIGSVPIFVGFLLNPEVLSSHLPSSDLTTFFINQDHFYKVTLISIILILFFVLKNLFIILVTIFQASMFRNLNVENAKRLFKAYVNTPYHLHLNFNPAIITRNIMGDMELGNSHISSLINLSREVLLIFVIFILLLWANPVSSLIVFFSIGSFGVIFYLTIRKKTLSLSKTALYNRGRQVQLVNQVFGAIKDVKILAREKYFTNEFNNETKGAEQLNFFSEVISKIPRLAMEIFAVITIF